MPNDTADFDYLEENEGSPQLAREDQQLNIPNPAAPSTPMGYNQNTGLIEPPPGPFTLADVAGLGIHPNILKPYSSWTYTITLLVTNPENYNMFLYQQKFESNLWTTILKSGGVGPTRTHRPASKNTASLGSPSSTESSPPPASSATPAGKKTYFTRDLYIDDLEMQTIIGMSQSSRGSNVTQLTFKIYEPYGMTFIDELYDFCHDVDGLNVDNYIQLPYLLKIDFMGYTEDGVASRIPHATKYIPISIANITVKLDFKGAVYTVSAIPFNELAMTNAFGVTNGLVTASGNNLAEICDSLAYSFTSFQQDLQATQDIEWGDFYAIKFIPQSSGETNASKIDIGASVVKTSSDDDPATNQTPMGTPISSGEDAVGNSKFDAEARARNISAYQVMNTQTHAGSSINYANGSVTFNSGCSIVDCLNDLIIGSEYIADQIAIFKQNVQMIAKKMLNADTDAARRQIWDTDGPSLSYPLKWFKIVSEVRLGAYDHKRNTYQKFITFNVKPYLINGAYSNLAPKQVPASSLRVLKEYEYMFTGENTEILNFDIDFNAAYVIYSASNSATKPLATGGKVPGSPSTTTATLTSPKDIISLAKITIPTPTNPKIPIGVGQTTQRRSDAADVAATIYSRGDLLQAKLTIAGDPDYIHQDSIFLHPGTTMAAYSSGGNGQSSGILFDNGEVYFHLRFRTPVDYDQETGLSELASISSIKGKKRNLYDAYYRILTVDNKFSGGKFTQDLTAIRFNDDNTGLPDASHNNIASGGFLLEDQDVTSTKVYDQKYDPNYSPTTPSTPAPYLGPEQ